MATDVTWEDHYKNATAPLPWDIGTPAPELQSAFKELDMAGRPVLEIGCGTGTNAIWMAEQGCKVVATDISPTAIDIAKGKAKESAVEVEFAVADICRDRAVENESVDLVFDRGVFHVMAEDKRALFCECVADALNTGGYWLCLAGSKDEVRANPDQGPPQLAAAEIVNAVEKLFEIHRLERSNFTLPNGAMHVAWEVVMRRR